MAVEIATAYVALVPSARGIAGQIGAQLGGPAAAAGVQAGEQAGAGLATGVGGGAAGAGALVKKLAIVPLLGVGVAALASAKTVDGAYNTIRSGTGATGAKLDGLKASFDNVAKSTPAAMGDVAGAIADVNRRLGLTGAPLETVTLGLVRLSRLTGTDLKTNVAGMARVFNDWNIPAKNQAATLDKVFRASQRTGIGVDVLGQQVTTFGGPLRQLGFGFDQSLAMIGKFEKAGVNTSQVLGAMKLGLGKAAKAGEDPAKAFARVTGEIKNAGSQAEANEKAIALFGSRAGPELALAIREGKLELGDLTAQIAGGKDTLATAAKDTGTLAGKFGILKNQATLALAPIGAPVLDTFTQLASNAIPIVATLGRAFGGLPGPVRQALVLLVAFAALRGPLTKLFGIGKDVGALGLKFFKMGKDVAISTFNMVRQTAALIAQKVAAFAAAAAQKAMAAAQWLLNAAMSANPITLIVIALVALVAGLVLAYTKIGWFRALVDTAFRAIRTAIAFVFDWVKEHWPLLLAILTGPIGLAVLVVVKHWDTIKAAVLAAVSFVRDVVVAVIGGLVAAWSFYWSVVGAIASAVWSGITSAVSAGLGFVRGLLDGFIGGFKAAWSGLWSVLPAAVSAVAGGVRSAFDAVLGGVKAAWNAFRSIWNATQLSVPSVEIAGKKFGGFTIGLPDLPEFRRNGGDVVAGRPYFVGEGGVELFTPDQSGTITPHGALAGGPAVQIENMYAWDARDAARQIANEAAFARLAGR